VSNESPVRRRPAAAAAPIPLDQVWFTVSEAATRARCSNRTVYRAIHNGELRTEQRGRAGAHHRIHRAEIDAWVRGERPQQLRPTG
jgi:excisionase family DNA binding protein